MPTLTVIITTSMMRVIIPSLVLAPATASPIMSMVPTGPDRSLMPYLPVMRSPRLRHIMVATEYSIFPAWTRVDHTVFSMPSTLKSYISRFFPFSPTSSWNWTPLSSTVFFFPSTARRTVMSMMPSSSLCMIMTMSESVTVRLPSILTISSPGRRPV